MDDTAGIVMPVNKQLGFSMLEVLISMLVIMIGVLGIAGMQMLAINNTENARYQSLATILASSMAAEIQANTAYWGSPPSSLIQVSNAAATVVPAVAGTCLGSVCTPVQMAYYDLSTWGTALAGRLPSGAGTIQCYSTTPAVCALTLTWSEKNTAISNPTGAETGQLATGTVSTHSYQTLVSIQP
jgi:type IV pilus assembly protein PilV